MKKVLFIMLVFICAGQLPAMAADLGSIGRAMNALGSGEGMLSGAGIDLDKAAGYLDWERLNVSLKADMASTLQLAGRTARVDSTVYKKGVTGIRIDIQGALQLQDKGKPLNFPGCYILEYPLRDKAYFVFPRKGGYMEIDPEKVREMLGNQLEKSKKNPGTVEKKEKLGTEELGGRLCEKMHLVKTTGSGAKNDITAWLAKDLGGFPVKTVLQFVLPRGQQGSGTVLFSNIIKGEQESALFELPGGYEKYNNLVELATEGRMGSRRGKPGDRPRNH